MINLTKYDNGFKLTFLWVLGISILKQKWEYGTCKNLTLSAGKAEATLSLGWRHKEPRIEDIINQMDSKFRAEA